MKKIEKVQASKVSLRVEDLLRTLEPPSKNPISSTVNKHLLDHYGEIQKKGKISKPSADALYHRLMSQKEKKAERLIGLKTRRARETYRECTHTPKINRTRSCSNLKGLKDRTKDILEVRRKKREEMRQKGLMEMEFELVEKCTFTPKINKTKRHQKRNLIDLFEWQKKASEKVKKSRKEKDMKKDEGATFTPRICKKSKKIVEQKRKGAGPMEKTPVKSKSKIRRKRTGFRRRKKTDLGIVVKHKSKPRRFKKKKKEQQRKAFGTPRKGKKSLSRRHRKAKSLTGTPTTACSFGQSFYGRSIVVLNENDEFEEIEKYMQKKKKEIKLQQKENEVAREVLEKQKRLHRQNKSRKKKVQKENINLFAKNRMKVPEHNSRVLKSKMDKLVRKSPSPLQKLKKPSLDVTYDQVKSMILEEKFEKMNQLPLKKKPKKHKLGRKKRASKKLENPWETSGQKKFLLIDGQRIYFNESTIDELIDKQRSKKIQNSALNINSYR
jgi:hypothetical protein